MANRKKKAKICDKGSSQGEDLISKLPDDLICDILYHLPTEESIRTSVLSKRWRNIWRCVLGLHLVDPKTFSTRDAYMSFIDKFLDSYKKSWMRKLRLYVDYGHDDDTSLLTLWIDAVTRRKVQHLDISTYDSIYDIPLNMYTCETLVHLRLHIATLTNAEFVSLPCLKILCLEFVENETMLEKLISGSPVLEDLTIASEDHDILMMKRFYKCALRR